MMLQRWPAMYLSMDEYLEYLVNTPRWWCVIAHSLYVTNRQRPANREREYWVKSLVLAFVGTFAGSAMASMILGLKPQWLLEDRYVFTLVVIWYLMNYCVGDLVHTLYNFPVLRQLGVAAEWLHKTQSMTRAVDNAILFYSHSVSAAVVAGVVSSYGGSFITTLERQQRGEGLYTELSKPAWTIRVVFFGAVFYYYVTFAGDPETLKGDNGYYMSKWHAKLCLLTFFMLCAVIRESIYAKFNPFAPVEWLFYLVTGLPTSEAQAAKSKKSKTQFLKAFQEMGDLAPADREELIREIRKRTVPSLKEGRPRLDTDSSDKGDDISTSSARKDGSTLTRRKSKGKAT